MREQLDLDAAVSLLTRDTPQPVRTEDSDGNPVVSFRMWPSLLGQLREAIKGSIGAGSGGGSGRPTPLALNAFDLMRKIEETSTYQYWTSGGTDRLTALSVEKRIRFWAMKALANPEKEREAARMISGWCNEIEDLFNPEHRIELKGKCPACGLTHYEVDEDGDTIRKPALTAVPTEGGAHASCGNCGAKWEGVALHLLAAFL